MIDRTSGLRLMKTYWVIIEVSEGLGGWMGIRGRLEGIMEGLGMVHAIRLPHSSQSFHPYQSFYPCQNSPISVSFHLESPSRTSLLPYIHSIILSRIVFPSLHGVHVCCELPVGIHARCMLGGCMVGISDIKSDIHVNHTCMAYTGRDCGIHWLGNIYLTGLGEETDSLDSLDNMDDG